MQTALDSYYAQGDQRSRKVRFLFDKIASRYDWINDLQSFGFHRVWKRRLVALASVGDSRRILDVCCGTGDISFSLNKAVPSAEIFGLDFSTEMLDVANRRGRGILLEPQVQPTKPVPRFFQGDAMCLPFRSGTFDVLTISYGLRNLVDFECAIREFLRVLTPKGRLLILEFGKPDNRLWRRIYFGYLATAVPVFGRIFAGDTKAYEYILESLRHYPGQTGIANLLLRAGCDDVKIENLVGGAMAIIKAEKGSG